MTQREGQTKVVNQVEEVTSKALLRAPGGERDGARRAMSVAREPRGFSGGRALSNMPRTPANNPEPLTAGGVVSSLNCNQLPPVSSMEEFKGH